jgi:hypothetical protein
MLAKYIIKKYGYKWDDNWTDTNNILKVMQTMDSLDENLINVAQDCLDYLRPKEILCPYCGEKSNSTDPKILCADCRETFGHYSIDEL